MNGGTTTAGEWFPFWAPPAEGRTVEDRGANSPHHAFDEKRLSETLVCSIAPNAKARLPGFKVLLEECTWARVLRLLNKAPGRIHIQRAASQRAA